MAATLALLLAMSTLIISGVEMKQDDLVFLEVDSGKSDEDLSRTFRNRLIIRRGLSGKEVGTSKYFAVLREPDLAKLQLKDVEEVTPVRKVEERMENRTILWPIHPEINNTDLWLFKVSPSLKGQTQQQYEVEFKHFLRTVAPIMQDFRHRAYISKGSIPPKYYVLVNKKEEFSKWFKSVLDIFGGPGSTKVKASYVQILIHPL